MPTPTDPAAASGPETSDAFAAPAAFSDPAAPEAPRASGTRGEAGAAPPRWQLPGGRERVAAYPRPPVLEPCGRHLRVEALGQVLAETERSLRLLETFHPPTFYLPPEAIELAWLQPAPGHSYCEWKGVARYFDVVVPGDAGLPRRLSRAVWQYPEPAPAYAALAGWYALYPGLMDGCWIDGERVIPQPGGFYGGWITSELEGPFKGDPLHPELV